MKRLFSYLKLVISFFSLKSCLISVFSYGEFYLRFNSNIDMYGYHREMDKSGETSGGWYMGLYHADGKDTYTKPKKSADVFKYMDTKSYSSHVSSYMKKYLGTSWTSKIPGWNPSKFK